MALATVLYLVALALWPEFLNHNSEYRWPLLHHGSALQLIPAGLALLVILAVLVSYHRRTDWPGLSRAQKTQTFLLLALTGLALQLIPISVHRLGLLELPVRVYLPDHTSYFTDAVRLKHEPDWKQKFPELVPQLHTHSRTHPPGAISFFQVFLRAAEKMPRWTDWLHHRVPRLQQAAEHFHLRPDEIAAGVLAAGAMLALAILAVLMFYHTARAWGVREEVAWLGASFFLFTPTFSHKSPVLDQFFAFLIFLGLWMFTAKSRKPGWGIVAGLVLGAGLWWSYTALAGLPLAAGLAAVWWWKDRSFPLFWAWAALGFGFVIAIVVLAGVSEADLRAVYRANLAGWYFNNTVSGRVQMWKWILFNPYEFFAWLGVPLFLFFALAVAREFKAAWRRQWDRIDPLVWAVVLFGLALNFSGRVCYESPRLAWFYAPLVCLVAAKGFAETPGADRAGPLAVVIVLQTAAVLVFRMRF